MCPPLAACHKFRVFSASSSRTRSADHGAGFGSCLYDEDLCISGRRGGGLCSTLSLRCQTSAEFFLRANHKDGDDDDDAIILVTEKSECAETPLHAAHWPEWHMNGYQK
ncbi:uncharacterized protein LOC126569843 [Anopheles aquasalis]|uniref:uncharacterized protein LOC126569843 n=1 Tax=Anopheles aquasalis TaxID=42839 RepID=UPI00215B0685|nr:uncharacterized protein LOC126569843 [Anopheles aquasalis]